MPIRNLTTIFQPRHVAVIGTSRKRASLGSKVLRNLPDAGFSGAIHEEDDQRKLVGVGWLVADADHTNAEYAVLVPDAYQGRGLGSMLTDYCLEICQGWGIGTVVAETAACSASLPTADLNWIAPYRPTCYSATSREAKVGKRERIAASP